MAGELMEDTAWSPEIEKIYLSESYAGKHKNELPVIESRAGMEILSDAVFAHVSDTKTPQGILAVVKRKAYRMDDILGGNPSAAHILVLDNLQDPGNLGTIFRTAEAAGVTGIILSRDCVDIYNPKGDPLHNGRGVPRSLPLCGRSAGNDRRAEARGNQGICCPLKRKKGI